MCYFQGKGSNEIRCRKDGNWTGSFRLCPHSQGQCSLPQNLHYSLQYSCKRGHGIGLYAQIYCYLMLFYNRFIFHTLPNHCDIVSQWFGNDEENKSRHSWCWSFISVILSVTLSHKQNTGEECELTCREGNNDVVILPHNMTVGKVMKEHWRNPPKLKVSLHVFVCASQLWETHFTKFCEAQLFSLEFHI